MHSEWVLQLIKKIFILMVFVLVLVVGAGSVFGAPKCGEAGGPTTCGTYDAQYTYYTGANTCDPPCTGTGNTGDPVICTGPCYAQATCNDNTGTYDSCAFDWEGGDWTGAPTAKIKEHLSDIGDLKTCGSNPCNAATLTKLLAAIKELYPNFNGGLIFQSGGSNKVTISSDGTLTNSIVVNGVTKTKTIKIKDAKIGANGKIEALKDGGFKITFDPSCTACSLNDPNWGTFAGKGSITIGPKGQIILSDVTWEFDHVWMVVGGSGTFWPDADFMTSGKGKCEACKDVVFHIGYKEGNDWHLAYVYIDKNGADVYVNKDLPSDKNGVGINGPTEVNGLGIEVRGIKGTKVQALIRDAVMQVEVDGYFKYVGRDANKPDADYSKGKAYFRKIKSGDKVQISNDGKRMVTATRTTDGKLDFKGCDFVETGCGTLEFRKLFETHKALFKEHFDKYKTDIYLYNDKDEVAGILVKGKFFCGYGMSTGTTPSADSECVTADSAKCSVGQAEDIICACGFTDKVAETGHPGCKEIFAYRVITTGKCECKKKGILKCPEEEKCTVGEKICDTKDTKKTKVCEKYMHQEGPAGKKIECFRWKDVPCGENECCKEGVCGKSNCKKPCTVGGNECTGTGECCKDGFCTTTGCKTCTIGGNECDTSKGECCKNNVCTTTGCGECSTATGCDDKDICKGTTWVDYYCALGGKCLFTEIPNHTTKCPECVNDTICDTKDACNGQTYTNYSCDTTKGKCDFTTTEKSPECPECSSDSQCSADSCINQTHYRDNSCSNGFCSYVDSLNRNLCSECQSNAECDEKDQCLASSYRDWSCDLGLGKCAYTETERPPKCYASKIVLTIEDIYGEVAEGNLKRGEFIAKIALADGRKISSIYKFDVYAGNDILLDSSGVTSPDTGFTYSGKFDLSSLSTDVSHTINLNIVVTDEHNFQANFQGSRTVEKIEYLQKPSVVVE